MELLRVGTGLSTIRACLQMLECTLRCRIAAKRLFGNAEFERMGDCDYLRSLVKSMPRRMTDNVIERAGNMTKY